MLAIVAPYAHDLRGPYRRKQRRLIEGDRVNAARAQSFDIAIRFFGRGKKKPYNRVASRNRLDQTVLRLSVKLKSAVFHRSLSNHTFRISWLNCQLFANFADSNLALWGRLACFFGASALISSQVHRRDRVGVALA